MKKKPTAAEEIAELRRTIRDRARELELLLSAKGPCRCEVPLPGRLYHAQSCCVLCDRLIA